MNLLGIGNMVVVDEREGDDSSSSNPRRNLLAAHSELHLHCAHVAGNLIKGHDHGAAILRDFGHDPFRRVPLYAPGVLRASKRGEGGNAHQAERSAAHHLVTSSVEPPPRRAVFRLSLVKAEPNSLTSMNW